LILAIIGGVFAFTKYQATQTELTKLKQNPQSVAQQEVKDLVAQVGKIVELPTGETPTVATITDKSKLTDQQFFANAQNGDKVLIYVQAKKAYLYRPSTNKLIDIAPVNVGTASASPSPSATPKK